MATLKQINKVQTLEQLNALNIGTVDYEFGYRGGNLGFHGSDVAESFKIDSNYLPRMYGAYCNYLGGGIRGAISPSGFSDSVPEVKAKRLRALADACIRVYNNLEDESGLNDTEDEDGDTNWDALATKGARRSGIVSAY